MRSLLLFPLLLTVTACRPLPPSPSQQFQKLPKELLEEIEQEKKKRKPTEQASAKEPAINLSSNLFVENQSSRASHSLQTPDLELFLRPSGYQLYIQWSIPLALWQQETKEKPCSLLLDLLYAKAQAEQVLIPIEKPRGALSFYLRKNQLAMKGKLLSHKITLLFGEEEIAQHREALWQEMIEVHPHLLPMENGPHPY